MRLILFPYKVDAVFDHTAHKRLWLWLALRPWAEKTEWPGWRDCYPQLHNCFACAFASVVKHEMMRQYPTASLCMFCPLQINDKLKCLNNWYNFWDETEKTPKNYPLLTQIALKIANLPIREGVRYV